MTLECGIRFLTDYLEGDVYFHTSRISSVVQTNSASSEESAAVSSELFEQVHVLEDETKRFKLKGAHQMTRPVQGKSGRRAV